MTKKFTKKEIEERLERFEDAAVSNDIEGLARDEGLHQKMRQWIIDGIDDADIKRLSCLHLGIKPPKDV